MHIDDDVHSGTDVCVAEGYTGHTDMIAKGKGELKMRC